MNDIAAILSFMIVGWAVLWPLRNALGPGPYHVVALPVGLLSAPIAGGVSSLTNRPLDGVSYAAGAVVLMIGVWSIHRLTSDAVDSSRVSVGSFALAGSVVGAVASVFGVIRLTLSNSDSFMAYWPMGVELSRYGAYTSTIVGARSHLLPAVNAVHALFGSNWAYVIYPMLGLTVVAWLLLTVGSGPLRRASRLGRWTVLAGAGMLLVTEPSFLHQSVFVHSHMITAVYLLIAITSLVLAMQADTQRAGGEVNGAAYMVLAGLATAGVALSRPDGLAYQFVPVALAISALVGPRIRVRAVASYFAPLLFTVLTVYAATYLELGIWRSGKLSGKKALVILAVLVVSAAGPWIIEWAARRLRVRMDGERVSALIVSGAALAVTGVMWIKWDTAQLAFKNARINIFEGAGGYAHLWYAVVLLLVVSVLTGDAWRPRSFTRPVFTSVIMFFVVAAAVHGTAHEGRVGFGDSFNRVAFHVLPLVVWYAAAVMARIIAERAAEPEPAE